MNEEKQARFKRLAEARTGKIIDYISLLGNLSNTSHYEYTQDQVDTIFDAIQQELELQRGKFYSKTSKRKFRL